MLKLTIDRYWFNKILSGEKLEEYREIKKFYDSRLNKEYNFVSFRNGYRKDSPYITLKLNGIRKGKGKKEWGAPDYDVYILELGEIICVENL